VPQRVNKLIKINVALIKFVRSFSPFPRPADVHFPLGNGSLVCVCGQFGELYLILYTELIVFVFYLVGVACRKNART